MGQLAFALVAVALGCTFLRTVLEWMGSIVLAGWSPLVLGLAMGFAARSAFRKRPTGRWVVISFGITLAALVIGSFSPLGDPIRRILYIYPNLFALAFSTGPTVREKQGRDRAEAMRARDDDQRALFEREAARPRPPPRATTAPVRFACAECGELTVESELTTHGGRKLCPACVEA
jgi:hypothetical protein